MKKTEQEKDDKRTSEKPVSLAPLKFREALANLLAVKPKPKEEEPEEALKALLQTKPKKEVDKTKSESGRDGQT